MKIVKLMGGLGNQMFQYAFGRALAARTQEKVLFDKSWFADASKTIVGTTGKNAQGVSIRAFELYIFSGLDIEYATRDQVEAMRKKTLLSKWRKLINLPPFPNVVKEKCEFCYDQDIMCLTGDKYFDGYFQNENYFRAIKSELQKAFMLPPLREDDTYNKELLKRIQSYPNSVFVHVRREDYVQLGYLTTQNYYQNAVKYIRQRIKNPKFFVFCAEDPDYIRKEFDMGAEFEFIGEHNKTRESFYENMRLMMACRHAILANSTFSWWAAWLSDFDGKIVTAPSPWINGQDGIICEHWVKIDNN